MPAIKTGSKVPEFSLPTTGGGTWRLKDAAGIVGVSRDSLASHDKFTARETLPFRLLADTELDGAGKLRQEWRKLKVPGHAEAVLEAARSL